MAPVVQSVLSKVNFAIVVVVDINWRRVIFVALWQ
jgi:hypothetical protein